MRESQDHKWAASTLAPLASATGQATGGIPPDPSAMTAAARAMGQSPAGPLVVFDDPPADLATAIDAAVVVPAVACAVVAITVVRSSQAPLPRAIRTVGMLPRSHPSPPPPSSSSVLLSSSFFFCSSSFFFSSSFFLFSSSVA